MKMSVVVALLVPTIAFAGQMVRYDVPVTLSGTIDMLPATDIQMGNEVQVHFPALILDAPITAVPNPKFPDEVQATTDAVQLVATGQTYDQVRKLAGTRVTVQCHDLFPQETAHHFEPVLCTVQSLARSGSTSVAMPYYEPRRFCDHVNNAGGHPSQMLLQQCMRNEQESYNSVKLRLSSIPPQQMGTCRHTAEFGGFPSYSLLDECLKQEAESAQQNSDFQFKR